MMKVILLGWSIIILGFVLEILFANGQTVQLVPFKPDIYPNDSRVFCLEDIGELPSTSSAPYSSTELGNVLVCRTDRRPCCANKTNRFGEWTHDNMNINTRGKKEDYFRTRDDVQQIHLSRRAMYSGTHRTGVFCCVLPDANSVTRMQCVEIVSTSLSITLSSSGDRLVGGTFSLTCSASVSGGGSVSRIVWLRGTTIEMEMNTVSTLILTFQPLNASDEGSYTCRVEVGNLVKMKSTELEVLISNPISSVTVTPSSPTLTAGDDSLTLTCSATITAGTPSFSWTGPESRGPIAVQQGSTTFTDTFVLGRVKESQRGTFTCLVSVTSTLTAEASVTVAVQVPSISVSITGSGDGDAVALRSYTLTCSVTAPATLDLTSPSYRWIRNGVVSGETGQTFIFTPQLNEVNSVYMYTCQYTAISPYLSNNVDVTSPGHRISIIVGTPSAPTSLMGTPLSTSISLTWSQSSDDIVDSYTISYSRMAGCASAPSDSEIITGPTTSYLLPFLEEVTVYVITIKAKNTAGFSPASNSFVGMTLAAVPSCCVPSPISQSVSLTSITIMWQREDCLLRNGQSRHYSVRYREAGSSTIIATATTISVNDRTYTASSLYPRTSYTFEVALVNEVGTGPYSTSNISTSSPTSLGLLLGSVLYSNNSVVNLTDIGEERAALFCLTDRAACCRRRDIGDSGRGVWLLPGGSSVIGSLGVKAGKFYRSRGASAVLLNRDSAAWGPSGVFTCDIPDSADLPQQVFVGIYPPDAGSLLKPSLTYNTTSGVLTCESTGGPASNVTWNRTGSSYQQSQRVVNTSTATYHNLLSINSSLLSDYSGSFSCSVSNSRGCSPTTTMAYQSIALSGQQTLYPLGSSASVTCFSNLTVLSIQWLNASSSGALLANGTSGQQQLVLDIVNITRDINNTQYSCEVSILLPTGTTVVDRRSLMLIAGDSTVRSPTSISVTDTSSSAVTAQWMFLEPFNATHKETCIVMFGETSGSLDSRSSVVTAGGGRLTYSVPLNSLAPGTDYKYVIQCWNKFDSVGITSEEMSFRTSDSESGPVRGLATTSPSDSTLVISWSSPAMPNGVITSFLVSINDHDMTSNGEVTNYTASDLVAGVPYTVSVAAVNMAGTGRFIVTVVFTRELEPSISPKDIEVVRISGSMMRVSWTRLTLSEARGFITHYTVAYTPSSSGNKRQEPNTLYQTVGNDSSEATIEGLDGSTVYTVQVSASTAAGDGDYSSLKSVPIIDAGGDGVSGVVIGVIILLVLVIFAVVLAVVGIFVIRRHSKKRFSPVSGISVVFTKNQKKASVKMATTNREVAFTSKDAEAEEEQGNGLDYENTIDIVKNRLKCIPVDEFGSHVARMHADRDKWFELEYNAIDRSARSENSAAQIPENRARNRFGNIFPYDFNRVVLNTLPGVENSDYINASYIDGFGRERVYIAAQGPTENSVTDFWRMIWEDHVPTIVMLTRTFEGKKKCEEYWPKSTSDPYVPAPESPFTVALTSSLPFAEFVIRKMTLTKTDDPNTPPLKLTMFHYLGWPDHGVPANAIAMINFIKGVRKSHPYSKEDLLMVHCSAGVGRTGTFITLDYMLERIRAEKTINIYEFVCNLRKQRVLMVQTMAQYVFIHAALDELYNCGETEIAAGNMRIIIGRLGRFVAGSNVTGFEKQYETLRKVTQEVLGADFTNSSREPNSLKNRYNDKLPFDHTRVRLRPSATQGSDYINACFVEGYRQKAAYIATQGPLSNTVNDFWRMIWEHEAKCIVMLCRSEENEVEVCHRYWPKSRGKTETYGKLSVTLLSQEICNDYMIRKMEITETHSRMSVSSGFNVTQFQYVKWTEEGVPQTTSSILDLANQVQRVQMASGNKAIVVMCNDGVGRSGAFICMHAQMERMKAEAVVDIFQFIKSVRFQRDGLVSNKLQYEFCHEVLADFLDGFETYANFKEII